MNYIYAAFFCGQKKCVCVFLLLKKRKIKKMSQSKFNPISTPDINFHTWMSNRHHQFFICSTCGTKQSIPPSQDCMSSIQYCGKCKNHKFVQLVKK